MRQPSRIPFGRVNDLPRLAEALPTLAAALRTSLLGEGEQALAEQVDELRVHATCACGEEGCLSLYVAPRRDSPCGHGYRVVLPDGVISIGVCGERMEFIEDNALIRDREDTPARSSEYRAVVGRVPTRSPTDL
jgi:hypothetical protein